MATKIGCLVNYGGGSQTIPARTITPFRFNTLVYDTGLYNTDSFTSTLPVSGIYLFGVSIYHKNLSLSSSSLPLYYLLYVNDVMVDTQFSIIKGSTQSHHISMSWDCNTGDVVRMSVYSPDADITFTDTDKVDSIDLKGLSSLSITRC